MDFEALSAALSQRTLRSMEGHRPCAVLVPLVVEDGEDCLLFEARAATLRLQPGEVCFPGGRLKETESPEECALRETAEELGIPPEHIQILGPLDYTLHLTGSTVYPYLARLGETWRETLRPNPAEVAEVFTIPLSWLESNSPLQVSTARRFLATSPLPQHLQPLISGELRPDRTPLLFWQYGDRLLWGMTARIVDWLLHRLPRQA